MIAAVVLLAVAFVAPVFFMIGVIYATDRILGRSQRADISAALERGK